MSTAGGEGQGFRPGPVQALLCDADGNLFPSEEPAFDASTEVLNELFAEMGIDLVLDGQELRRRASGRTFRSIAVELLEGRGAKVEEPELERWVARETAHVTSHLGAVLEPDPRVIDPLEELARRFELAVVSSSALSRLEACFRASALDELFPAEKRFSAEDSLANPKSKPHPDVYLHAAGVLGIEPEAGLAVEDAVAGVQSAVGAGCPTVGNVSFVPAGEREERVAQLRHHGAITVVESWDELRTLLEVS